MVDANSQQKKTRESLRNDLSETLVVPRFRLRVSYTGLPLTTDDFLGPWRPNLQRIAPK